MADREKVIDGLRRCESYGYCEDKQCPYYEYTGCLELLRSDALSLLKAQEPQPPKHRHEEYPEHDWEREKDGSIDEFAMEVGYHNGPECKRCGKTFCIHCEPNGYITHRPCIIDEDYCPRCGRHIFRSWGTALSFCESCGQAVKWG